ncbi:hypothetical protein SNEBB_006272 [Seison nebaliae]|nr:hypothetical protein SNEBB_006272 [Seison nebaliae]
MKDSTELVTFSPESPKNENKLEKSIGLLSATLLIINIIMGTGIFISPTGVIKHCDSIGVSLIIWLACGLLTLCGALSYSELGTMIPSSGGDYVYLKESYGRLAAFLFVWTMFVAANPGACAVISYTVAIYTLKPFYGMQCDPPSSAVILLALFFVLTVVFINCRSVAFSNRMNNFFTFCKLIAIFSIIIIGIVYLIMEPRRGQLLMENFWTSNKLSFKGILMSFYAGMFSYGGFNYLNFVAEEIKRPERNLPLAICLAIPIIIIVYILVNISYFIIMTKEEILSSPAVALTFAEKSIGIASIAMSIFVALSAFGSLNGCVLACARIYYSAANNGEMPTFIGMVHNQYKTPITSVIVQGIIICILIIVSSDIYAIINYAIFTVFLFIGIAISTILYQRKVNPDRERPIKIPLALPIIFVLISIFIVINSIYASPYDCGIGFLFVVMGIPVYFLGVKWQKPKKYFRISGNFTRTLQQLLICSPQSKDE